MPARPTRAGSGTLKPLLGCGALLLLCAALFVPPYEARTPFDATGRYVRFPGGFLNPDIAQPTVTAGFSPLFRQRRAPPGAPLNDVPSFF